MHRFLKISFLRHLVQTPQFSNSQPSDFLKHHNSVQRKPAAPKTQFLVFLYERRWFSLANASTENIHQTVVPIGATDDVGAFAATRASRRVILFPVRCLASPRLSCFDP